ncbi:MAG: hypothetical protein ACREDR_30160 [Blastocatellia bacterium]
MGQMTKSLINDSRAGSSPKSEEDDDDLEEPLDPQYLAKQLERIKWFLWHGNVIRALDTIEYVADILDAAHETDNVRKLLKAVKEFDHYIEANASFIPNYGDRYRHGETISTAFVESTVNFVVSKRIVKKQQMQWSQRGAHNLLQVRTKVLNNDELRHVFATWYPGMCPRTDAAERAA